METNMIKRLKSSGGFSMLEMVLALVMGSLIVGATSQSLLDNVDSYTFIANRKSALGDARYAMNRMTQELLKVKSTSNLTISNIKGVQFNDDTGTSVGFYIDSNGASGNALWRGDVSDGTADDQKLVDNISVFNVSYYDANGATVATNGDSTLVKRITIQLSTAAIGNEGSVSLQTTVTPRDFIGYANYQ
jgi:Tfp pilus assembly protein PilW